MLFDMSTATEVISKLEDLTKHRKTVEGILSKAVKHHSETIRKAAEKQRAKKSAVQGSVEKRIHTLYHLLVDSSTMVRRAKKKKTDEGEVTVEVTELPTAAVSLCEGYLSEIEELRKRRSEEVGDTDPQRADDLSKNAPAVQHHKALLYRNFGALEQAIREFQALLDPDETAQAEDHFRIIYLSDFVRALYLSAIERRKERAAMTSEVPLSEGRKSEMDALVEDILAAKGGEQSLRRLLAGRLSSESTIQADVESFAEKTSGLCSRTGQRSAAIAEALALSADSSEDFVLALREAETWSLAEQELEKIMRLSEQGVDDLEAGRKRESLAVVEGYSAYDLKFFSQADLYARWPSQEDLASPAIEQACSAERPPSKWHPFYGVAALTDPAWLSFLSEEVKKEWLDGLDKMSSKFSFLRRCAKGAVAASAIGAAFVGALPDQAGDAVPAPIDDGGNQGHDASPSASDSGGQHDSGPGSASGDLAAQDGDSNVDGKGDGEWQGNENALDTASLDQAMTALPCDRLQSDPDFLDQILHAVRQTEEGEVLLSDESSDITRALVSDICAFPDIRHYVEELVMVSGRPELLAAKESVQQRLTAGFDSWYKRRPHIAHSGHADSDRGLA